MINKTMKPILIIAIIAMTLSLTGGSSPRVGAEKDLIRFHVIANSDSIRDQAIKLRVRDRLLDEFGSLLGQCGSASDSRSIIEEKLKSIEAVAQEEVDRYTKGCEVKATLGDFPFPTKVYGDRVLPAGNYEALRIIIGSGKGANWWCVMFPPLCFVDISHGIAKDEEGDGSDPLIEVHRWEDREEYKKNRENSGDHGVSNLKSGESYEVRVEYRFKLLEWWEEIKGRF